MNNSEVLKGIKVGDTITADFLNKISTAINRNTQAFRRPSSQPTPNNAALSVPAGTSGGLTDLTFTAQSVTEATVTVTDSAGDTHDVNVLEAVALDNASGDTLTLIFPASLWTT